MSPFDLDGVTELIRRIGEFVTAENLPAEPRDRLQNAVNCYARHLEAGVRLEAWLENADCCSARGLRADRRDKLLKWLDTGGSKLHAEQHAG